VAGLIATLRADLIWPRLLKHKRGLGLPMLLTLTAAGGLMTGLAWALPAAEPVVTRALSPWLQGEEAKSGFGLGSIRLGKLAKINTSDRLVLRVHGQADYLRGQVYLDYAWGHWNRRAQVVQERPVVDGTFIFSDARVEQTIRIESEPEAAMALFAPLQTVRVDDAPEGVQADQYGVLRVPPDLHSEPLIWSLGISAATPKHIDPPTERDLALVERVRPAWETLAGQWTTPEQAPKAKIAAFVERFRSEFRYSLDLPQAPRRQDPVLYFATQARYGHCEYFASALIMLARSQGIPARMVTGYRVFERSGNGWAIVRDRDAHAWAEVWLDGRWTTVEPTPPGSLAGENLPPPSWLATQWDAFKRWLRRAVEWLGDLTARELVPVGAVIIALIGLLIWIRRRRPAPQPQLQSGFAPLEALESALDGKGVHRAPHQTLRQFSQVVRSAGHADAAELIDRCARWLYAQRGDPEAIAQAVARWVG
jgi:transglutaminase-like putative cysteine protease